jgi:hypothetical protein
MPTAFDPVAAIVRESGRASAEAGRHETHLDARGLPSGIYFLRLQVGPTLKTQKLTVVQ